MGRRMKRRGNYKFSDKIHPITGIVSVILALCSLAILIALSLFSSKSNGNGGTAIGLLGLFSFALSITGLVFSIIAVKKEEIHYTFPVAGMGLNGLLMIMYILLYVVGIFL